MADRENYSVNQLHFDPVYTTSTLPSNSKTLVGTVVAVSDAGVGDNFTLVINDGTNWIDVTTGAAVVA